jgi:predicted nucleic acid-binding protein
VRVGAEWTCDERAAAAGAVEWRGGSTRRGGLFRRDYGRIHSTGLADALIAATADQVRAHLVTLNRRHFPMLSDVHVPYSK